MKALYVKILNKSRTDMVPPLIFGLITFLYGFAIYYLLPLALLSLDLGLTLEVFFFILIGLLLGISILAINI